MKTIIAILTVIGAMNVMGKELPAKFLKAIHQVETGGRKGAIKGDEGRALGPFQIHYGYWLDSGVAGSYEQCAGYDYSVKVVTAYLKRYGSHYINKRDWQALARIHNGGPKGFKNKITLDYWKKVKQYI